eukprot:3125542-Prymnesium_polylepis.1
MDRAKGEWDALARMLSLLGHTAKAAARGQIGHLRPQRSRPHSFLVEQPGGLLKLPLQRCFLTCVMCPLLRPCLLLLPSNLIELIALCTLSLEPHALGFEAVLLRLESHALSIPLCLAPRALGLPLGLPLGLTPVQLGLHVCDNLLSSLARL